MTRLCAVATAAMRHSALRPLVVLLSVFGRSSVTVMTRQVLMIECVATGTSIAWCLLGAGERSWW